MTKLESDLSLLKFGQKKVQMQRVRTFLRNYTRLKVYGFNASRFDMPVLFPGLIRILRDQEAHKRLANSVNVLKAGAKYFSVSTSKYVFGDTLNFTSPCNLSKYLQQWKIKEKKSIFPYQKFNSVEDLSETVFPKITDFFSNLTGKTVDPDLYQETKKYYENCQKLPTDHPDHLSDMRGFLKYYNLLDVEPLGSGLKLLDTSNLC